MDDVDALRNSESPIARFIDDDGWKIGPEYEVEKDNLYDDYRHWWCERQGMKRPMNRDWFFRRLRDALPDLYDRRPDDPKDTGRPRVIVGIGRPPQKEEGT